MNLTIRHGARLTPTTPNQTSIRVGIATIWNNSGRVSRLKPWTRRDLSTKTQTRVWLSKHRPGAQLIWRKRMSISSRQFDEYRRSTSPVTATAPPGAVNDSANGLSPSEASSLPSRKETRRWQISKRVSRVMDTLLARASIASQHINSYTGTDYSGIEALRTEIITQEQKVREHHQSIEDARTEHRDAHSKQAAAQKEIVSLLERKASWSPTDLERYMSLVRSEHTNEQAVQTAKDGLTVAEQNLEASRSLLERLERRQYHEEQIWSDTIRRNSTWVTFGLMGVNIILLLAQIAIFEPYRRRKIVKEVQKALDEKTVTGPSVAAEKQEGEAIESAGERVENVEDSGTTEPISITTQPLDAFGPGKAESSKTTSASAEVLLGEHLVGDQRVYPGTWSGVRSAYMEGLQDLFSERLIQVKKVDMTNVALQGAATGIATMGLLFVLLRPR